VRAGGGLCCVAVCWCAAKGIHRGQKRGDKVPLQVPLTDGNTCLLRHGVAQSRPHNENSGSSPSYDQTTPCSEENKGILDSSAGEKVWSGTRGSNSRHPAWEAARRQSQVLQPKDLQTPPIFLAPTLAPALRGPLRKNLRGPSGHWPSACAPCRPRTGPDCCGCSRQASRHPDSFPCPYAENTLTNLPEMACGFPDAASPFSGMVPAAPEARHAGERGPNWRTCRGRVGTETPRAPLTTHWAATGLGSLH